MAGPTFRRDQYDTDYPQEGNPLVPGQIGASLAAGAFHQPNGRVSVVNPRSNPPQVEAAPITTPSSVRAFRGPADPGRPRNNEEGVTLEGPNTFVWTQNGGAPSGAPDDVFDEAAHMGFDPMYGRPTEMVGIGPLNTGGFSSMLPKATDQQAHEVHRHTDFSDKRRDRSAALPEKAYETSAYDNENFAGRLVPVNPQIMYEKPYEWFLRGRPAKVIHANTFVRPFDQWAAHNMTAVKALPSSPRNVGGQVIDATPHASLPLRTTVESEVPGDAYSGAYFPAPGMQGYSGTRNTFRLQPEPWDEFLVVDPGVR